MRKYKWHILLLVRAIICGKSINEINTRKVDNDCDKIITALAKPGESVKEPFNKAVHIIQSFGEITDDRLKRQTIMDEMLQRIG